MSQMMVPQSLCQGKYYTKYMNQDGTIFDLYNIPDLVKLFQGAAGDKIGAL